MLYHGLWSNRKDTSRWRILPCFNGNVWEIVPGVQVEPMTAKEVKVARMESQKRIQAEKMELKNCPGFIMKGVAGKHSQEQLNGAYVRIPGVMKNGRPVFAFVGKDKCWGNSGYGHVLR